MGGDAKGAKKGEKKGQKGAQTGQGKGPQNVGGKGKGPWWTPAWQAADWLPALLAGLYSKGAAQGGGGRVYPVQAGGGRKGGTTAKGEAGKGKGTTPGRPWTCNSCGETGNNRAYEDCKTCHTVWTYKGPRAEAEKILKGDSSKEGREEVRGSSSGKDKKTKDEGLRGRDFGPQEAKKPPKGGEEWVQVVRRALASGKAEVHEQGAGKGCKGKTAGGGGAKFFPKEGMGEDEDDGQGEGADEGGHEAEAVEGDPQLQEKVKQGLQALEVLRNIGLVKDQGDQEYLGRLLEDMRAYGHDKEDEAGGKGQGKSKGGKGASATAQLHKSKGRIMRLQKIRDKLQGEKDELDELLEQLDEHVERLEARIVDIEQDIDQEKVHKKRLAHRVAREEGRSDSEDDDDEDMDTDEERMEGGKATPQASARANEPTGLHQEQMPQTAARLASQIRKGASPVGDALLGAIADFMAGATKHEFVVPPRPVESGQQVRQGTAAAAAEGRDKATAKAVLEVLQKRYQDELAQGREMAKDHLEALGKLQEELDEDEDEPALGAGTTAATEDGREGKGGARAVRPSPYGKDSATREVSKA